MSGVQQGSTLGPLLFLMHENDLPLFTKFSVTLYAEYTYLMLSDYYLGSLEKNVNVKLAKIDYWMRVDKISLNYSKTNDMLTYKNKLAKISDLEFNVSINQNLISRTSSVKYFGVFIDDELTWTSEINQVALKLSKYNRIIYKLRNYVDSETLLMLNYNLAYSYIQFEITV